MKSKAIITSSDVKHVADLAQLHLKKGEFKKFKGQLVKIFNYIGLISQMKTENVKETSQDTGITNRFRKDKIRRETMLSQNEALSNAKQKYKGYFVVKAIFEE